MKKLIIALTILLIFPLNAFAQTANQNNDIAGVLTSIEDERAQKLKDELGITIPQETDNPNHIITFKDPSGKGVKLEIDGQGFKTVKSPYTLPSLGIGSHVLTFRFTDSQESSQTLETDMVVVPRPPVLNAPDIASKGEITVKGTSLASSTVEIFISGDTLHFKGSTEVGADGNWSFTFKENFKYAIYTVIARTKKNGFSSSLSEPVVFELTAKENTSGTVITSQPIYFNFREFTPAKFISNIKNNPHLLILAAAFAVLGGIVTSIIESVSSRKVNKTAEGKFIKLLSDKDANRKKDNDQKKDVKTPSVGMTLREKFEKAGIKVPEKETKAKELTKEEFMEAYKEEDPDNARGVEKKDEPKDEKKKVAVSLTSKRN